MLREYQTAKGLDSTKQGSTESERYFLSDAKFLAAVEGPAGLIEGLAEAVRRPHYLPYLGRRSCPPAGPISFGVRDGSLAERLRAVPWQASEWYQRRDRRAMIELEAIVDGEPGDPRSETIRDEPLSFAPALRRYGWRSVVRNPISDGVRRYPADQGGAMVVPVRDHDPMSALGG